jgi:pyruvate-formate lyase-activating enzyme
VDLNSIKSQLNTLSPTFCGAKWYNATVWLGSGKTTSCHHPPAHKVSVESIKQNYKMLHNTPEKKDDRRKMQLGERPVGCEYCWKIEDMAVDSISDRVYKSMVYTKSDLIEASTRDYNEDIDLKTLEIAFDGTCQFACSYCNPSFSTTWVKDIKKYGPYIDIADSRNHYKDEHSSDHLYTYNESNPYVEAFFKWWETDLHKTLNRLRITGGEPLMSGHTWKLLDWFNENKSKSKTRLAINTNLGFDKDVLERLLASTENVQLEIYTSNEAVGKYAEYIRDGLDWEQWVSNMKFLIESKRILNLHVMFTVNSLCLESLPNLLNLLLEWKQQYDTSIGFSINIQRFPSFQSAIVLPLDIRTQYSQRITTWLDENRQNNLLQNNEINQIQRLIDYLQLVDIPHGLNFDREQIQREYKSFYSQYDVRRNKNFEETFKDSLLIDWYKSLKV